MNCFVKENTFATEEKEKISDSTVASEKLQLLLLKISDLLKSDDSRGFYMMLKVMKEHGGKGTRTLADHIVNRLKISAEKLSEICSDDVHVKSDQTKGLSLCSAVHYTYLYLF